MKTLAIETSCDDTSVAVIEYTGSTFDVIHLLSYTQLIHQKYGGVVPEIASREHATHILVLLEEIVERENAKKKDKSQTKRSDATSERSNKHITHKKIHIFPLSKEKRLETKIHFTVFFNTIDTISYTAMPGLPGSLVVAKVVAQTLAHLYNKPLIPVNHILGHLHSIYIERSLDDVQFPMIVLTVSGGHNDIYYFENKEQLLPTGPMSEIHGKKLGTALDDAGGECFDKTARMLGGPYPGGPRIGQQADLSINHTLPILSKHPQTTFTRPLIKEDGYDMSFSGVKHQVQRFLKHMEEENISLTPKYVTDIAWEAQETITDILVTKAIRATQTYHAKTLAVVGGVSANKVLWKKLSKEIEKINKTTTNGQFTPIQLTKPAKIIYSTDNAAMIGVVGLLS